MSEGPLDEALFAIIAKEGQVDRASLTRDLPLKDAGIASIEVISILFAVEDQFGVGIETADLEGCTTLGDLVDRLHERLA